MTKIWWRLFTGEGAMCKMHGFNAFSRNLNTIKMKIFTNHGKIQRFERKLKELVEI